MNDIDLNENGNQPREEVVRFASLDTGDEVLAYPSPTAEGHVSLALAHDAQLAHFLAAGLAQGLWCWEQSAQAGCRGGQVGAKAFDQTRAQVDATLPNGNYTLKAIAPTFGAVNTAGLCDKVGNPLNRSGFKPNGGNSLQSFSVNTTSSAVSLPNPSPKRSQPV